MTSITVYAELLLNIRQVTVHTALPSPTNHSTTFKLSTDRKSLRVLHNNYEAEFALPCQVAENVLLTQPPSGLSEVSFRLQIAGERQKVTRDDVPIQGQDVIWPASTMAPRTQIACRSCRNVVVDQTVSAWKSLPSEDWAEMMDFWHCHKPHVDDAVDGHQKGLTKGYTASSRLTAQPGVGLVDTLHFLLAEGDCMGIKVSRLAPASELLALFSNFIKTWATRRRHVPTACWIYGISADTSAL